MPKTTYVLVILCVYIVEERAESCSPNISSQTNPAFVPKKKASSHHAWQGVELISEEETVRHGENGNAQRADGGRDGGNWQGQESPEKNKYSVTDSRWGTAARQRNVHEQSPGS